MPVRKLARLGVQMGDWQKAWGGRSCVFIGEKGMLLGDGRLLPEEKFKDFEAPPEELKKLFPGP